MAVCDADYRFTFVDIGDYGSLNDAGIWANSYIGRTLNDGAIQLPQPRRLPNSNVAVPFCFVGDEAFPLKTFLKRPYARRQLLGIEQRVFNYRLSRARRIIENSFGIWMARWRIIQTAIGLKLSTAELIVKATLCLHNFVISTEREISDNTRYVDKSIVDREGPDGEIIEGDWRQVVNDENRLLHCLGRKGANNGTAAAIENRNVLAQYFVTDGAVPWHKYVYLPK